MSMIHSESGDNKTKYRINEIIGSIPFTINNFGIQIVSWYILKLKALIEIINPPKAITEDTPCKIPLARSKLKIPTRIIPPLPIIPVINLYLENLVSFSDLSNLFDKK